MRSGLQTDEAGMQVRPQGAAAPQADGVAAGLSGSTRPDDAVGPQAGASAQASADAIEPDCAPAPRTPEETVEALVARVNGNHANTLAYLACLKACRGEARPYREVEEGLLGSSAFSVSMQTPHTLLGFLVADGGVERIDVEPAEATGAGEAGAPCGQPDAGTAVSGGSPVGPVQAGFAEAESGAPCGQSAAGEIGVPCERPVDGSAARGGSPAVPASGTPVPATPGPGTTAAPSPASPETLARPVDYLLRTTPEGEAVLVRFDAVAGFERLLAAEPDGYLDAYLVVLDACADEGASLKDVEAALSGHPALTNPKRVYAGYFISKLEHLGAIAWSDAWHTTPDGERIVSALAQAC